MPPMWFHAVDDIHHQFLLERAPASHKELVKVNLAEVSYHLPNDICRKLRIFKVLDGRHLVGYVGHKETIDWSLLWT